jgi:hypothetical protein
VTRASGSSSMTSNGAGVKLAPLCGIPLQALLVLSAFDKRRAGQNSATGRRA